MRSGKRPSRSERLGLLPRGGSTGYSGAGADERMAQPAAW